MKFLLILLLLIPVITASDEHKSEKSDKVSKSRKEPKKAQALRQTVKANTEFAINFFKLLTSASTQDTDSPPQNVVFSPFSISSAFSMMLLGAQKQTHQEMWKGLSLHNTHCREMEVHQAYSNLLQVLNEPKSSLQVNIGNAIFVNQSLTLLESFEDDARRYYHAEIIEEDFSDLQKVENKINAYVKNKTEGKIEDLIKNLHKHAQLVLINYVLFKGEWQEPFDSDSTTVEKFFVDKDTEVDVPMMYHTGYYNIYHDTDLPCTVVELPYKDNASMIIAMAEPGKIHEVEQGFSAKTIQRWRTSLSKEYIKLHMPKFSISSTIDLREALKAFGINIAFSDEADFLGITSEVRLKVEKAIHKAVLDVNEKGTVAAAVVAISFRRLAFEEINIDRPFISIIYEHNTNSILFMATVMNPAQE
ncbi:corticosteroid-binding globulin-like [Aquarana catesbeiana]|uniref:corticosteroid-binding globulin-like n=1 Tax=Aquarana catesbeiana TaxID=8400 RepID=UPI003CCA51B2